MAPVQVLVQAAARELVASLPREAANMAGVCPSEVQGGSPMPPREALALALDSYTSLADGTVEVSATGSAAGGMWGYAYGCCRTFLSGVSHP